MERRKKDRRRFFRKGSSDRRQALGNSQPALDPVIMTIGLSTIIMVSALLYAAAQF